jgi:uncharacterized protein YkwD
MSSGSLSPRTRLHVEQLESRLAPSSLQPSPIEQEFLERLNDARANPAAYGRSIGLSLAGVRPSQPLAFNTQLISAARGHSLDMANRGYFAHVTPEGITPHQRIHAAGFPSFSDGESIDMAEIPTFVFTDPTNPAGSTVREVYPPEAALADFIVDRGVPDLGHRRHLLAIDRFAAKDTQVGVGFAFRDFTASNGFPITAFFYTVDTGYLGHKQQFLTGSVFRDSNGNGLYDAGEGLAGVTIRVGSLKPVRDFDSGGYTVPLKHGGTYRVTASGGGLAAPLTRTIHVGGQNARLNFIVP